MRKLKTTLAAVVALATGATALTSAAPAGNDTATIVHVLSRITFGVRPDDVARVQQRGLARFIDEQLHPEKLPDAALGTRLRDLETLDLDSRTIAQRYALPLLQARRARRAAAANTPAAADPGQPGAAAPPASAPMPPRRADANVVQQANLPLVELSEQKLLRAAYSDRQLQEVLADFWFNHFNVDARKGPARYMLTEYEREAIRPHVLGRFRDLLEATAKSPAMLFYLDNWMSADPKGPRQRAGLNENYGRELLELHTLGVDGGYTQNDVTEVARAFTGWTIENPRLGGGFRFARALHDDGEKVVLGHRIKAGGGERDGETVLDLLALHPSTARFISTKLARRFVSDTPPPALVDRMADTFRRTGGDLRAVMTTLLSSPEFLGTAARAAKVKTPFEFVVSAIRATGADVTDARPLVRAVQQLGMPLYQCQPPTGYADTADRWVNTGALVNRMNVALAMAGGRMPGVSPTMPANAESVVAQPLSDATKSTIAKAAKPQQALALALGSPEFQRR
jgi:uncharacterized protein (DUF1800 family)